MTAETKPGNRFPAAALLAVVVVLLAFGIGFGLGGQSDFNIGQKARAILGAIGKPQLEAYQAQYQPASGKVDYLLFFRDAAEIDHGKTYLRDVMAIDTIEPTVFKRGVVISLVEPATALVDKLRSLPFVWMVLRDRPFFFCH